jgi:hypothetical protein
MLLCFLRDIELVGSGVSIIGRWLCMISNCIDCVELLSDSKLGSDLLKFHVAIIRMRKAPMNG